MSETVRVLAFDYNPPNNPVIVRETEMEGVFDELCGAITYGEPGDRYSIEVREMSEAELNALPEWDGF